MISYGALLAAERHKKSDVKKVKTRLELRYQRFIDYIRGNNRDS